MKHVLVSLLAFVFLILPATATATATADAQAKGQADMRADTAFIVNAMFASSHVDQRLAQLSEQSLMTVELGISHLGATIIDRDGFTKALLGDMDEQILEGVLANWVTMYEQVFTEAELADLATFFRSEQGQIWLAFNPSQKTLLPEEINFLTGGRADLMIRMPYALDNPETLAAEVRSVVKNFITMDRIADVLAQDTLVAFESETERQRVVDALRRAQSSDQAE